MSKPIKEFGEPVDLDTVVAKFLTNGEESFVCCLQCFPAIHTAGFQIVDKRAYYSDKIHYSRGRIDRAGFNCDYCGVRYVYRFRNHRLR